MFHKVVARSADSAAENAEPKGEHFWRFPRFLLQASYTADGAKGLLREGGTSRRSTLEQLTQSLGGRLEAFSYAFGEDDVYLICDFPDNATAAAVSLTVNAAGAARAKTTALLTAEEIDEACGKSVDYRPPGA